jgi:hypothetical protein
MDLFGWRMAATVTSVDRFVFVLGLRVIWVRVSDAMRTNPFHDPPVTSPVLRPIAHMVVAGIVDTAMLPLTF